MVDILVRWDQYHLGLHSVELPLNCGKEVLKDLFVSEIGASLIRMQDKDITSDDILVIDIDEWPHKDDSLRLFLSCDSQEVQQPLVGQRIFHCEWATCHHDLNRSILVVLINNFLQLFNVRVASRHALDV